MFDIPPAIETYCGTEVAEIVQYVDPRAVNNTEKIRAVYNSFRNLSEPNSCQDSLMFYFLTLIDGQQSDEYINGIIYYITSDVLINAIYPNTISLIKEKIPLIKYQYNSSFSDSYFILLIKLNYPINDNIKDIDVANDKYQLWNKSLYLAHNEDSEAIEYLRNEMKNIEDASTVLNLLKSLIYIKKNVRDKLLSDYTEDNRIVYGVTESFDLTLGERVNSLLEMD